MTARGAVMWWQDPSVGWSDSHGSHATWSHIQAAVSALALVPSAIRPAARVPRADSDVTVRLEPPRRTRWPHDRRVDHGCSRVALRAVQRASPLSAAVTAALVIGHGH